jgi:2-polyprenyl-3-methyl-5-hydroxy-6-metoxy-1,4-benzoquinol methylase
VEARLRDTQAAFDSVAADYDGPRGNNALIQEMRHEMWRWLDRTFTTQSRLLDLGCGTGLDAIRMAQRGHIVTATDWSSSMVERTAERAKQSAVYTTVDALQIGAHELHRIDGQAHYDGIYSNLGPLNCIPDLQAVSRECARLLRPGGALVFTVIGRICPWEIAWYAGKRQWPRIKVRFARQLVPVSMNGHTIWTRYYTPREFYKEFLSSFTLAHYRGLCVFAPPPYLTQIREQYARLHHWLWQMDRAAAGWPLLREFGDHFLIILRKRPDGH